MVKSPFEHKSKANFNILDTNKSFWQIGRLNFQSVHDILKIRSRLFRIHYYHAEWIKQLSGVGVQVRKNKINFALH